MAAWRRTVAAVILAVPAALASTGAQPEQVFRAAVETVVLDVAVLRGGVPVRGLAAQHFTIVDNGTARPAAQVFHEAVPLNLVLCLDTSSSLGASGLERLRDAAEGLLQSLRPDDRLGLVTFSEAVDVRVVPTTRHDDVRAALRLLAPQGPTAWRDALFVASQLVEPTNRARSVVLLLTDGADTSSWMSDAQIDTIIDVHLKGAFYVSQPAFRVMKDAGYGRIVFTGSSSGMFGHAWHASYGAAKAGIMGLMNVVALEGVPHGILANAIMPNAVTRISESVSKGFMDNKPFAETMTRVNFAPLLPSVKAEWTAPLAVYLASKACQSTHNLYSQAGNRYARVFIGVTEGWRSPGDQPPSPEALGAHWSEIEDRATYYLPLTNYDELAFVSPLKSD